MSTLIKELKIGLVVTGLIGVIVCGFYPLLVFVAAQALFPDQANGSLIYHDARVVGSRLLGQPFAGPGYFHPRPSAAGAGYDAAASNGSNLGPTSQTLIDNVAERVKVHREENGLGPDASMPADAVTASASGLDPHISVENAALQVDRVAAARKMSIETVQELVQKYTESRDLGVFGEPRVNVLELNLALDGIQE